MPQHKDLEFHIDVADGETRVFDNFDAAAGFAVARALSRGGEDVIIDVVTWSQDGARAWGGDSAVEIYDEDPESSVHERLCISAGSQGPVR